MVPRKYYTAVVCMYYVGYVSPLSKPPHASNTGARCKTVAYLVRIIRIQSDKLQEYFVPRILILKLNVPHMRVLSSH